MFKNKELEDSCIQALGRHGYSKDDILSIEESHKKTKLGTEMNAYIRLKNGRNFSKTTIQKKEK